MEPLPTEKNEHPDRRLKVIAMLVVLLFIGGGLYLATNRTALPPEERVEEPVPPITVRDVHVPYTTRSGLSFMYDASTYVAISPELLELIPEETVVLFNRKDYEDLQNSTGPREGPTAITLYIFDNPENKSAGEWILENPEVSNYDEALGRLQVREVVSYDAVAYRFTGLYEGDATAFTKDDKLYLFSVTWLRPDDAMRSDFEKILSSIRFR